MIGLCWLHVTKKVTIRESKSARMSFMAAVTGFVGGTLVQCVLIPQTAPVWRALLPVLWKLYYHSPNIFEVMRKTSRSKRVGIACRSLFM